MAGYLVPLLLVTLILIAIALWRVVHPPLALGFTALVSCFALGYVAFSVIPRMLGAVRAPDVAAAPFAATARQAYPDDLAIQLYRGADLLGECALAGPSSTLVRAPEPLRLERHASGHGYQVWSGATLVGDLPETSLVALEPAPAPPTPPDPEPAKPARAPSGPPVFFLTGKLAVGGSYSLQLPEAGAVTLQFLRLNERGLAVVKLNAPELGAADPPTLELNNKAALTQSFERMHFDVAIREASFIADPAWAQFAIMAHP